MAQLPLYYNKNKLVGPKSTTKRWKEYYLLVITIVGFIILIAGVLWFVPGMEEDKSYNKAYDSFTALGDVDIVETRKPTPELPVLRRDVEDPRSRKLEQELPPGPEPSTEDKHPPKVKEDTPIQKESRDQSENGGHVSEELNENVQVEVNDDRGAVIDESAETRQRREKVVDVSHTDCCFYCSCRQSLYFENLHRNGIIPTIV